MIKQKHIIFASMVVLLAAYQNCGQAFMNKSSDTGDFASSGLSVESEYKSSNPVALLSYEQVFKSMVSVTGVPANNGAINQEFDRRSSLFASSYDLKNVNPPMLMGIANLASVFCNQTLNTEVGAASTARKFFTDVDFNRNVASFTDPILVSSAEKMALSFWGRNLSADEISLLKNSKAEFLADYTATELNATASSRNLALYTCTAMLASNDSYTF